MHGFYFYFVVYFVLPLDLFNLFFITMMLLTFVEFI